MFRRDFAEDLAGRAGFASAGFGKAPAEQVDRASLLRIFQQLLVGGGALNDELGLAIHREHLRASRLLEPAKVPPGVTLKISERTNVCQIDHGHLNIELSA